MQLANAAQGAAAGLRAGRLRGRPTTSTPASFVWTRAVSACHAAHDEVSVGNCPREASTSQGVGWVGGWVVEGEGEGEGMVLEEVVVGADRERNDGQASSFSFSKSFSPFFFFTWTFLFHSSTAALHTKVFGLLNSCCLKFQFRPGRLCCLSPVCLCDKTAE